MNKKIFNLSLPFLILGFIGSIIFTIEYWMAHFDKTSSALQWLIVSICVLVCGLLIYLMALKLEEEPTQESEKEVKENATTNNEARQSYY